QSVNSAYLEVQVPLVSEANRMTGIRGLDLQLAARHDGYSTTGATRVVVPAGAPLSAAQSERNEIGSTDPTVVRRYIPFQGLTFRASYGTGFLPPDVNSLVPNAPTTIPAGSALVDPRRNNEPLGLAGPVTAQAGGNPDLRAEQSQSWSAGFILAPAFAPDVRLSLDYTRISKRDN